MRQQFDSLSQRIAYGILATIPPFSPADTAPEEPQRQAHAFLRSAAGKLADRPDIIGLSSSPDEAFGDWELFKSNPELIDEMRKQHRKLEEFYGLLYNLGSAATVEGGRLSVEKAAIKVPGKSLKALEALGVSSEDQNGRLLLWSADFPELAAGWKTLCESAKGSGNPAYHFSRAIFNPVTPHAIEVFRSLADDPRAFGQLEAYFKRSNYRLVELREGISVDWVKPYGKKEEPLKGHWAEHTHGGLSILYDYRRRNPVIYGLRVPMYRELLNRFDDMDDTVKALVISRTKKCDGCRYCTQTDKTSKRPRQIVAVRHSDQDHDLCTMFPGFGYIWTKVDETEANRITGLLGFIDKVFSGGK